MTIETDVVDHDRDYKVRAAIVGAVLMLAVIYLVLR